MNAPQKNSRAQVIVIRGNRLLFVKHRKASDAWWCLPGGGIEPGETPAVAALRELREECLVEGKLVRLTSLAHFDHGYTEHTFLVEIGDQTPRLGHDPEESSFDDADKSLGDIAWLSPNELAERDRAYLWTAGLLTVEPFAKDLLSWSRKPTPPPRKASSKRG